MKKKITKLNLEGLRKAYPVLSKEEMHSCVGGKGDEQNNDWCSSEEFANWSGNWPGGWVYDLGYVPSDSFQEDENISLCNIENGEIPLFAAFYGGYSTYGDSYGNINNPQYSNLYFDMSKTLSYLAANAHNTSQGECAKYIRLALEAGGFDTTGHPIVAHEYDTYLKNVGFEVVDKNNYVPQPGDIVVHEAIEGHQYGHISMFDGNNWYSDFKQIDMHGGSDFRKSDTYTILRYHQN